jgi:drug/metabolite transporter (DMT)-like permease
MKSRYTFGLVLCLFAVLSWGGMFPVMGAMLRVANPFILTAIRYTLVAVLFVALLSAREGRAALRPQRLPLLWLLGSMGFAGFGFLAFLGQKLAGRSGAVAVSSMMALMPMLGVVLGWALRGVKPLRYSLLFVLMSFAGVITVVTRGNWEALASLRQNLVADLLMLAGAACWVVYTIGASYFPKWSPLRYTALTTTAGLTTTWALNLVLGLFGLNDIPSAAALASIVPQIVYMVVVAGFAGVLSWNSGNRILGSLNGVLFMDVVPLTTFVISALQGYRFSKGEIVGATLTGSALVMNNIYQRFASRPPAVAWIPPPALAPTHHSART